MTDRLDAPPDDSAIEIDVDDLDVSDQPSDRPRPDWSTLPGRAVDRIVRRPVEWASRPWPTDRIVRYVVTVFSLVLTTAIMMKVVHLNPFASRDLIFDDTTPTGGDFGAHVWGPAFLRDHLLPSWRLNGWSMDWYAGMPVYRFYMVVPAIAIVLVNVLLPYGVAMKLVSISGLVSLPLCCWAFGRLGRFRYPMPELFAFAGLAFVLDESFSIYGGNLKSTMAGEFSFSIALSLGVLALGVLSAGLRTGKYRVWAAVLIALACLSHGIVLLFVLGAAAVFCLVWIDRQRIVYAVTVLGTAVLLMFFWAGPFVLNHAFMTDMKYGKEPHGGSFDSWSDMYFPLTAPLDFVITSLAVIGLVSCVVRRHLNGAALGITGVLLVVAVWQAQHSLPVIGLLWNPRLLPFLYLVRYLMMMVGAVELMGLLYNLARDRRARQLPNAWEGAAFAGVGSLAVLVVLGWMFQVLPGGGLQIHDDASNGDDNDKAVYTWGPFVATDTNTKAVGNGWTSYNFRGYEGRNEYYTEYYNVVTAMQRLGDDPAHGCGRASWENNEDNGKYGTTMALMLLPFWTDGCIGSMEGLFFEASGTTPYHFLTTAAMSKQSSNPVRELRYVNNDSTVGVRHLQDLGVKYVMVRTTEAKAEAAESPELTLVASSYPWDVYQVQGADLVVPLTVQPVVVNGRSGDQRERNLELGTSWFQNPDEWAAMPADDGPDEWQRIDVAVDTSRHEENRVEIVQPVGQIDPVPLDPVTVSNVEINQQSLSFDVDRPGVPVLVKVSYFPNWDASGAEGPYRIGPNMMVVVPTDTHVELSYGRSATDSVAVLMTVAGIGACVVWRRRGDMEFDSELPAGFVRRPDEPVGEPVETPAEEHVDQPYDQGEWAAPTPDQPDSDAGG